MILRLLKMSRCFLHDTAVAVKMMTFFSKLAGLDFSSGFQTGYKKGFKQSAGYKAGIIAGEAAQRKKESKSAYLAQHALSTPALNAN
jgi:hypothetical protein